MRWRILGAAVLTAGVFGAAYLWWAYERLSYDAVWFDPEWPRPWPYPDGWLERWAARLDGEHPPRPELRMAGPIQDWRRPLSVGAVGCLVISLFGAVPWVLWIARRSRAKRAEWARDYAERPGEI